MARSRRPSDAESESSNTLSNDPAEDDVDSSSSDSDEEAENPLLDDEAAESDGESTSDSNSDEYDGHATFFGGEFEEFHKFLDLPPELRDRIWEYFCPDLVAGSRVLRVSVRMHSISGSHHPRDQVGSIGEGGYLTDQTEAIRCMAAVHKESRARVEKVAPDLLHLTEHGPHAVTRFNADRDIICLADIDRHPYPSSGQNRGFGGVVQHIAMSGSDEMLISQVIEHFEHLETVYDVTSDDALSDPWLMWCASGKVRKYYTQRMEQLEPVPIAHETIFCFPDPKDHKDFVKFNLEPFMDKVTPHGSQSLVNDASMNIFPMVMFDMDSGMDRLRSLEGRKSEPLPDLYELEKKEDEEGVLPVPWMRERYGPVGAEWGSSDMEDAAELSGNEEQDEYDSEGIDDEEIESVDESSEDEDIPRRISAPGETDDEDEEDEDEDELAVPIARVDDATANLSSLEPSEDEAEVSNEIRPRAKRRIVDSDDSDEEIGEPRQAKRRRVARTLASDSESDEVDEGVDAADKGVAQSASEDEDEDEDAVQSKRPKVRPGRRWTRIQRSESPEDSNDESDEDEQPKKRVTLAERLRGSHTTGKKKSRRQLSDDEGEEDSQVDSEEDDEDDDDDDDRDDVPRKRNPFFDDIASEEDDDDGEDEEDSEDE